MDAPKSLVELAHHKISYPFQWKTPLSVSIEPSPAQFHLVSSSTRCLRLQIAPRWVKARPQRSKAKTEAYMGAGLTKSIVFLLRAWISLRKIGAQLRDTLVLAIARKLEVMLRSTSCVLKNSTVVTLKESPPSIRLQKLARPTIRTKGMTHSQWISWSDPPLARPRVRHPIWRSILPKRNHCFRNSEQTEQTQCSWSKNWVSNIPHSDAPQANSPQLHLIKDPAPNAERSQKTLSSLSKSQSRPLSSLLEDKGLRVWFK